MIFEIARIILKHILERINETLVEEHCGKGMSREENIETVTQTEKSQFGEITLNLARVEVKVFLYMI